MHRIRRDFALLVCLLLLAGACANKPPGFPYVIEPAYAVEDSEFPRVMSALLGRPLIKGNQVETLLNGDEIFPPMLAAINAAQHNICFETYIYWSGSIGKKFADALALRAQSGVAVHVLIDAVGGGLMDEELIQQMRESGVELVFYHPVSLLSPSSLAEANFRTHRKILTVDGKVGFIGGVGIADKWLGNGDSPDEWRDNHYRVRGPVVAQLQSAFFDNWVDATGRVLHGANYYPPQSPVGSSTAQVVISSSESDGVKIQLMLLLSFAAAQREILLATPYLVPDDLTVRELIEARQRGVTIKLLIPGPHTDASFVQAASRDRWAELIEAGIELYAFQPTMMHSKLMIVDQLWTSLGSANLDNRSFSLNDEANLNVLDAEFAKQQHRIFERDLANSRRITLQDVESRSLFQEIGDWFAALFSPQL